MFETIIEPFRIKVVEQIKMTTPEQREEKIRAAGYNIFALHSDDVIIDLLTDSGTGAMSANQWGGVMRGDESYAGSPSYFHFRDSVQDITGFEYIIPTHQGRAAERILFSVMCSEGDVVPNNSHFDTTRANVEFRGAIALDLPSAELADMDSDYPFKGDMDVAGLRAAFAEHGTERIPLVMLTVTNNSGGGQPVSMANVREVAAVCREFDTPLYLDACRCAWAVVPGRGGSSERRQRRLIMGDSVNLLSGERAATSLIRLSSDGALIELDFYVDPSYVTVNVNYSGGRGGVGGAGGSRGVPGQGGAGGAGGAAGGNSNCPETSGQAGASGDSGETYLNNGLAGRKGADGWNGSDGTLWIYIYIEY